MGYYKFLTAKNLRRKPRTPGPLRNHSKPYTVQDWLLLDKLHRQRMPVKEIARKLGRTRIAVTKMIYDRKNSHKQPTTGAGV